MVSGLSRALVRGFGRLGRCGKGSEEVSPSRRRRVGQAVAEVGGGVGRVERLEFKCGRTDEGLLVRRVGEFAGTGEQDRSAGGLLGECAQRFGAVVGGDLVQAVEENGYPVCGEDFGRVCAAGAAGEER